MVEKRGHRIRLWSNARSNYDRKRSVNYWFYIVSRSGYGQTDSRCHLHSDGDDAFIFQPIVNYRTLEFDKALSSRHICQIVNRWADFAGLNQNPDKGDQDRPGSRKKPKPRLRLSPHDLRRTAVTRALSLGFTYRQVQSMTGHKDIRMVVKYDNYSPESPPFGVVLRKPPRFKPAE